MRWTKKIIEHGSKRIRSKFLWFPTYFLNENYEREYRWLETAKICQRYNEWIGWIDYKWAD